MTYSDLETLKIDISESENPKSLVYKHGELFCEHCCGDIRHELEVEWKPLLDSFSNSFSTFLQPSNVNTESSHVTISSHVSKCRLYGGGMKLWCVKQRVLSILKQYSWIKISL